jgi:preprotein translocase subunit YajC
VLLILLQAQGGNISFLLTMGAVFIVMYFFMMRPQQKKQKDQKIFLEEMKKGDQVVTIGGLHGKIHDLDELTVSLEVDRGFKLKFDRASISMEASKKVQKEEGEIKS